MKSYHPPGPGQFYAAPFESSEMLNVSEPMRKPNIKGETNFILFFSHSQDHAHAYNVHQQMQYHNYDAFNYQLEGAPQTNDYGASAAYQFSNSAETHAACKFFSSISIFTANTEIVARIHIQITFAYRLSHAWSTPTSASSAKCDVRTKTYILICGC